MPTSPLVRTLAVGAALQICAAASFAQASGVACQMDSSGAIWQLYDGLDDVKLGTLSAPLTRGCSSDSAWADGRYSVTVTNGALRVARTYGSDDFHSLTPKDRDAGIVFSGFAANANSFSMTVHSTDKQGNYVPDTRMHILVTGVDGTVLWSRYFKADDVYYSLGMSGGTPIASVTLKRSPTQPNGVGDSFPVVDFFYTAYDSNYGPNSTAQPQTYLGAK